MPPVHDPASDAQRTAAAVLDRIASTSPGSREAAAALLDRIPPQRWAIEWNLPFWLGRSLGVEDALSDQLAVATVLGLGAVRLQDDLADGDIPGERAPAAAELASLCWDQSLAANRELFPPDSTFWSKVEEAMSAWAEREERRSDLALRGAPLRVPAFGVCLLADRIDAYPSIAACLDRAVKALALEDDIGDWRTDLDAGRWNAFVAHATGEPRTDLANRDATRSNVLVAMLTTDAIATYVERIVTTLERASGEARRLRLDPLADHLATLSGATLEHGAALEAHYHETARQASALLTRDSH